MLRCQSVNVGLRGDCCRWCGWLCLLWWYHCGNIRLKRRRVWFTVQSRRPQWTLLTLDFGLDLNLNLDRLVGLREALGLGRGFTVLQLLQKDLTVQKLELSRVQIKHSILCFGKPADPLLKCARVHE